jgi:hypothetical protein
MAFVIKEPVSLPVRGKLFWRNTTTFYPVAHEGNGECSWIALCQDSHNAKWVADTLNAKLSEDE